MSGSVSALYRRGMPNLPLGIVRHDIDVDQYPLTAAAHSGDAERVRAVFRQGVADLEARPANGLTAFLAACVTGSVECIGLLAKVGCDKDAVVQGSTALMSAVYSRDAAAVRMVLDLGVMDREARDTGGATAFLHACFEGLAECIVVLAEAGCDKDATAGNGTTALMLAAGSGDAAAVRGRCWILV